MSTSKILLLRMLLASPAVFASLAQGAMPSEMNSLHKYTYPKGNLVANGSFEANRSMVDWSNWWEGLEHSSFFAHPEIDPAVAAIEGNRYLAVYYNSPGQVESALKVMSEFFPLRPNFKYTLFLRYRVIQSRGEVRPILRQWRAKSHVYDAGTDTFTKLTDNGGASYLTAADTGSVYQSTGGWTTYKLQFRAAPDANFGNIFLVWGREAGSGGKFYFDDVHLVEGHVDVQPLAATTRKYFDGGNRVVQDLRLLGNVGIVTASVYDDQGRLSKSALPIAHNYNAMSHGYLKEITGTFEPGDYLYRFYNPSEFPSLFSGPGIYGMPVGYPEAHGAPYSEIRYEDSPLGRTVELAGPGVQRSETGHTTRTTYASVAGLESSSWATGTSGEFFVRETTDPDDRVAREYIDRLGRVVRTSGKLNGSWIHTDYTLDGSGNTVKIEAPTTDGTRSTTNLQHDFLGKLLKETTPATGETKFLYDRMGNLRFSQTQVQAGQNAFSYSKYDSLGRVTETGDVLDAGYRTQALADDMRFPCTGCPGSLDPGSSLRVRARNHYDDSLTSDLTCGGSYAPLNLSTRITASPVVGSGSTGYLAVNSGGTAIAAGYDLQTVYTQARTTLGSASGKIQMLYTPGSQGALTNGSMILKEGTSRIELVALSRSSTPGGIAQTTFNSFNLQEGRDESLLGSAEYLKGRLVKSLACNWELADSLGHAAPREVSREMRYDAEGNITRLIEINAYVEDTDQQAQVTKTYYDVQNRPTEKIVCANLRCGLEASHSEQYVYDQMGRLSAVLGKGGTTFVQNKYNQIGQLILQNLGGGYRGDSIPMRRGYAYSAEGWLDSSLVMNNATTIFKQKLYHEDGASPLYGGDISRNDVTLAPSITEGYRRLWNRYSYDDLGRLTVADNTEGVLSGDAAYSYKPDGRIARFAEGPRFNLYYVYNQGRLDSLYGGLGDGYNRDFSQNGGHPFVYDANGNRIADYSKAVDGIPLRSHYRADGLPFLFTYKQGGDLVKVFMVYDEAGRRASKVTRKSDAWNGTKSSFASGKEVREALGEGKRLFYAMAGVGRVEYPEGNAKGRREVYITDHLGSTRQVYDLDSTKVTYWAHHFPYGESMVTEGMGEDRKPTEQFTSKELDKGLDLTYFGARYYDQDLGMWTSPDPARQFHGLYSYTGNNFNPIVGIDGDGKEINFYHRPVKVLGVTVGRHMFAEIIDPKTGEKQYASMQGSTWGGKTTRWVGKVGQGAWSDDVNSIDDESAVKFHSAKLADANQDALQNKAFISAFKGFYDYFFKDRYPSPAGQFDQKNGNSNTIIDMSASTIRHDLPDVPKAFLQNAKPEAKE